MAFRYTPTLDTDKLKCALCQNYLSVPPIMVISENGDDHKCGRCQCIETQINTRNKFIEDIVKLAKFPCIYENCKDELPWGAVEAHEQMCPHKMYRCSFLDDCSNFITINDLEAHYIAKEHTYSKMVHGKLELPNTFLDIVVYVLIKNKVPYLVYSDQTTENLWIAVFSLRSEPTKTTKYEVKLTTTDSDISVLYENGIVMSYNEREHCADCLFRECSLPYHKFSEVNEGNTNMTTYIQRTIISKAQVSTALGSDEFICTVNILDEPETLKINKPKLVTLEEPNSCSNNNKLLQQILQCPICLELMPAEIYTCRTGHAVCKACEPQLETCPTCREEINFSRNYALEEIAENVELTCGHEGCNFIGNVVNICKHQAQCPYKNS